MVQQRRGREEKCRHCGRVFERNHCPSCTGCKATESHAAWCPRDPENRRRASSPFLR